MRLSIPTQPGETRVAADPDAVRMLVARGVEVTVAAGVGSACRHSDADYAAAGAIVVDAERAWSDADVVCVVTAPDAADVHRLREGAVLVGQLAPGRDLDMVRALRERRITSYSLELIPRISRAQSMDTLSSQAGLAGYRAAVMSAAMLDKHLPLSMTAAGTLRPALVIVLGAGVAGLQAIATSKRLGAIVRANDVRAAAKGEVASLGGEFIDIPGVTDQEGDGGYAIAVGEDAARAQHEALLPHIKAADSVICTAALPGRRAPVLLTGDMVRAMRPGALVIDMAAEDGGNCELTDPSQETEVGGVRIVPASQLARTLPREASQLYARNVTSFLELLLDEAGGLLAEPDDELVTAARLTSADAVTFPPVAQALEQEGSD